MAHEFECHITQWVRPLTSLSPVQFASMTTTLIYLSNTVLQNAAIECPVGTCAAIIRTVSSLVWIMIRRIAFPRPSTSQMIRLLTGMREALKRCRCFSVDSSVDFSGSWWALVRMYISVSLTWPYNIRWRKCEYTNKRIRQKQSLAYDTVLKTIYTVVVVP